MIHPSSTDIIVRTMIVTGMRRKVNQS